MKKTNVLIFIDRMRVGGIQTLFVNLLDYFDTDKFKIDFLVLDDGIHYDLEDKIKQKGITVYKLNGIWLNKPIDFIKYRNSVNEFFSNHNDYDVVHMNSSSKNYMILKSAKKYGIPIRIAHSHNTDFQTTSKLKQIVGDMFKKPLLKYANKYFACSEYAGKWLFGSENIENGKVDIIPNGIDLEKYKFNIEKRNKIRCELKVEDKLVIGNIGRFTKQKNHTFLLEIFKNIHDINSNSVLIIAGIGELLDECIEKSKNLGIEDSVKFLGFRNDVTDLLQAMDIYIMPSLYEGFPITGIEAQSSGLPCIFSDTITREAKINNNIKYLSLNESPSVWAEESLKLDLKSDRSFCTDLLRKKRFDIRDTASMLEDAYSSVK